MTLIEAQAEYFLALADYEAASARPFSESLLSTAIANYER